MINSLKTLKTLLKIVEKKWLRNFSKTYIIFGMKQVRLNANNQSNEIYLTLINYDFKPD